MPLDANIIRRLASLRLAPEAMSEVLSIIADMQADDDIRKERDRNRKRIFREMSKECPRTVQGMSSENPGNVMEIPEDIPGPRARDIDNSSLDSKKERKKSLPKKFKHELPDDWEPDEGDLEYGRRLGLLNGHFGGQLEAMRLWAKANKIMKADWHATLKGFLRSHAEKVGVSAPITGPPSNSSKYVLRDTEAGCAWNDYKFRTTGKSQVWDAKGGWHFPSEYPPREEVSH